MTPSLKTEALAYLRFNRRCPLIATEVGDWSADVMGVTLDTAIEIETKVSKSDLLAEFRNKAAKHFLYDKAEDDRATANVPSFFYVLVPQNLAEYAAKVLEEKCPKAGLLLAPPEASTGYMRADRLRSARKATRLHKKAPNAKLVGHIAYRMSSELVKVRVQLDAAGVVGESFPLDHVPFAQDEGLYALHEARATWLAWVVGQERFEALDGPRQDFWRAASIREAEANFAAIEPLLNRKTI